MNKKIAIIVITLLFSSCTSEVIKESSSTGNTTKINKREAESIFIDGSISEMKGQFNEAVIQYLEALKYDPQPGIYYSIAKNYFRLNKLASALQYSRNAIKKDSSNIEFLTLHASIYTASHMDDSAAAVYQRIIRLDTTNVTAYYYLAQISEPRQPSIALSYYKKIIDLIGPEWNALIKIADINERMGNIDETIKTVEELIKMNPSELHLKKLLIESYIKTKQYDKAAAIIAETQISYPDDLNLIEMKGNIFIQQGLWKDASIEFMKLVKSPEINIEAKLKIGTSFYLQAEKDSVNYKYAEEIFQIINRDTSDWQANAYLGEIEIRNKNDSLAVGYLKTAVNLAEWNSQIWIRLGGLLFDSKRYKEAIQYMSKASEKFPNDFPINLIYGLSLSADNDHQRAKEALQRALNINPDDVTALSALGYTLNQLKDDDEALISLNKALSFEPANLQVISVIAMIHESRKNYAVSDSLYKEAVKIDSSNVLILNNYAYSLAERGINLQQALSMSKKAIEKEPKNSSYLDTIGWIYFRLGEYKKAKTNIEEAAKIEDKNATLIDHLGDVYFKLGNKIKALEFWKKAFELDSTKSEIKKKIEKGSL
ncbi:MAG: tetratricopeptide repeat protein [Ignavibacteriales bacterium]|nr:tetratricopeptide repeat protein [Ignavibacteriales bacterium]